MGDVYFWRQLFIELSFMMHSISNGLVAAFPSVLNPAILSPNATDIRATQDEASWIAASAGATGIIGLFIMSPIMQKYGRKTTHVCLNLFDAVGWIILPFANSVLLLILARLIQGISKGGVFINCIIISEYADPKRRGYFVTLKKCSVAVGVLLCHCLSQVCTWRQITVLGLILTLLAVTLTLFWPESPAYLAMKGRFAECEKNYHWLHGDSLEKDKELRMLMAAQTERIERRTHIKKGLVKQLIKKFYMRDFLTSIFIVLILMLAVDLCGKYYFVAYVIEIMIELIGNNPGAIYCSIASDLLTIVALISSSFIIFYFKRRTVVFSFGIASSLLMFMISLLEYLKNGFLLGSNLKWLTPTLILVLIFVVNLSIIPISFTISGEIFPLEHRGLGSCVSGIGFMAFYVLTMKCTPLMISKIGLQGTYLCYGICLSLCIVALYFILPETKDKTLQVIEDSIKNIKRTSVELKPIIFKEKKNNE